MSKDNYEIGGKVQISDEWHEITKCDEHLLVCGTNIDFIKRFIQAYEPPKVVHVWVNSVGVEIDRNSASYAQRSWKEKINTFLTERYGAPPIVRTYKNEDASVFNLKDESPVLYWAGTWETCLFEELIEGEHWYILPADPKVS